MPLSLQCKYLEGDNFTFVGSICSWNFVLSILSSVLAIFSMHVDLSLLYLNVLCLVVGYSPPGSSVCADFPGKNTGAGYHALLEGVGTTQESNPGLPDCRWILYHLSHQGSPRILEWVTYPFSRGSSQPKNQTRVSCIVGRFFTS